MAKYRGGLGFRSLHGFNLALLGKHVWNFLSNQHSLVARIFKARYFSECHILKAQLGKGVSFIWKGIWEAKEELCKGFRWVLGNRQSISIFSDPWLRGKSDFCVENHHVNNASTAKVCEYFRPNAKEWDVNKVEQTFQEDDVRCILQVRIPRNHVQDRVAWMATNDGRYTAKSGYHFWYNRNFDMSNEIESKGWNRLWKLQIPHKTKLILWHFCRNNIPVRNLLRGKGVQTTIICPMCNTDVEHLLHVFFDCDYAKRCWVKSGLSYDMGEVYSGPTWLLEKLCNEPEESLITIAKTLWGIWFARNNRVWEEKQLTPDSTMELSSRQIAEWQEAQRKNKRVARRLGN